METQILQLTPEMKDRLQKSMGFDVKSEFKYVPIDYRNPENEIPKECWPVWTLTSKDGVEIAELEDTSGKMLYDDRTKLTEMKLTTGSQRLKTLEGGIIKVDKFWIDSETYITFDKKRREITKVRGGNVIETIKSVVVRDFIKHMSADLQIEIQNAINERKTLTEEDLRGLE